MPWSLVYVSSLFASLATSAASETMRDGDVVASLLPCAPEGLESSSLPLPLLSWMFPDGTLLVIAASFQLAAGASAGV